MTTKQPADHKAPKGTPFTFKANGKSYAIPSADEARQKLDGGALEDAVLAGEIGMLAFLVKAVRASGATDEALAALRSLPQDKYLTTLQQWGEYGDGDGASLGE